MKKTVTSKEATSKEVLQQQIEALLKDQHPLTLVIAREALATANDFLGSTSAILGSLATGYVMTGEKVVELFGKDVGEGVIQHRLEAAAILVEAANKLAANDEAALKKFGPIVEARQKKQQKQLTA